MFTLAVRMVYAFLSQESVPWAWNGSPTTANAQVRATLGRVE
jgi:hypothetical protein